MHEASTLFAGAVTLVTGAASGIGQATARRFLELGARVVAVDLNWPVSAADALESALILQADVSVEAQASAAVQQASEAFGVLDVLVNCAGIMRRASVPETTVQDWDHVIDVNLRSVYLMSRQALESMRPRGAGCIVNVASGWGVVGGPRAAAYCASKGGVVLLTKAMAVDHGQEGIRVNCVCPGDTDTPMLRREAEEMGLAPDALLLSAQERPLGRAGRPEEIAEIVAFLASPSNSFMTGAVVVADGGSLAGTA